MCRIEVMNKIKKKLKKIADSVFVGGGVASCFVTGESGASRDRTIPLGEMNRTDQDI